MGAFELQDVGHEHHEAELAHEASGCAAIQARHVKEECIIALKVYDSCRRQDCLTPAEIGPARAAEAHALDGESCKEGDIIKPPKNAATVTIDHLRIKRIIIVDKQPCPFKNGFWDIDLKYVFEYRLTFREADGCVIDSVKANNIFNMKVSLFGSVGSDLVIGTDLMRSFGDSATFEAEPFIWVEAKAVTIKCLHIF